MDINVDEQKQKFSAWSKDNLGPKTGIWYSPYLEILGELLKQFQLDNGQDYYENFFHYQTFEAFKNIYQKIIGQTDTEITKILNGSPLRYPNSCAQKKVDWNQKYAQMTFVKGERSNPDNFGGIVDLGVLLRAYLKFLYYAENSSLSYPKKNKKTSTHEGKIDDSINYWLFAPGDDARLWPIFFSDNVMGLGWDFLGDLEEYDTRTAVEKEIAKYKK